MSKLNFYDLKSKIEGLLKDFKEICDREGRDYDEEVEECAEEGKNS